MSDASEPRVSAVVVAHDSGDHLERCVATLAAEGPPLLETIVVDNGSCDGAPARLRERFPAVRVVELGGNFGFGTANNRGAAVARGDQVLLLNADAWLASGTLAALSAALDRDPRLAAVAPELRYPDGRRQFVWCPETGVVGEAAQMLRNRFEARAWCHSPLLRAVLGPGWLTAACLLVRKAAFDAIGGFDEEIFLYFEDVDLSRRLRDAGWLLGTVPGAVAVHVKGGGSPFGDRELEYRRSQLRYYRKHRPAWERRYLRRRLRRKFDRIADAAERRRLLALLEAAP